MYEYENMVPLFKTCHIFDIQEANKLRHIYIRCHGGETKLPLNAALPNAILIWNQLFHKAL